MIGGKLLFFFGGRGAQFSITVRNFQGNTSTQALQQQPYLYVVGPPQYSVAVPAGTISAVNFPGPHQGLYIREKEPVQTPDGNPWYRWEEDQPVIGVSPTGYSAGVF